MEQYQITAWDGIIYLGLFLYTFSAFWSMTMLEISILIAFLAWLGKMAWQKDWRLLKSPLNLPILIFILSGIPSIIVALDKGEALWKWQGLISMVLPYYIVLNNIKSLDLAKKLIQCLTFSAALAAVYGITQHFNGIDRATGTLNTYMTFGGSMMMMSVLSIVLFLQTENRKEKILYALAAILTSVALIYTFTRGAWIGWITASIFWGVLKDKRLILALAILIICCLLFIPGVMDRTKSIVDLDQQSNSERLKLWQSASKMIVDYPLTGVGLGNFNILYNAGYALPTAVERNLGHAHNNFFQIGAEMGFISLTAFGFLVYVMLKSAWESFRHNKNPYWKSFSLGVFAVLLAFFIQGLTEFNFGDGEVIRLVWFLLGITVLSQNYIKYLAVIENN